MTNREKFKEVFGIDIPKTENYFCTLVDDHECLGCGTCDEKCQAFGWWDKEYTGVPSIKTLDVASMDEKLIELKGIVKLLRFAESLEDRAVSREITKFCAEDIEELTGGKKK